ncbi:MAG: hypothetical protein JSW50_16910 [Candidatus Latescibacterota bacterium]|nr:MAG: hypothetical protein JSW50_16910 [Candidatus Latescibacterota bacterium]
MASPYSLLPAETNGWTASGEDTVYKGNELYTYINGGAELYISYGFKSVVSRTYTRPDEPDIIVDVFDMGSSQDAFGVFAHSREIIDDTVGQGSQYTTGLLLFWKNRYFVSVLASPETVESKKAVYNIGRAVAKAIPEDGPLPDILGLLPGDALIEESIRYFHHYVWLNSHYFIADENILRIDDSTDAVLAKYTEGRARGILLVIDYPDIAAAKTAQAGFLKVYLPDLDEQPAVRLEDDTWAGCRRSDSVLSIVLNAQSQETVVGLLDAVQTKVAERKSVE